MAACDILIPAFRLFAIILAASQCAAGFSLPAWRTQEKDRSVGLNKRDGTNTPAPISVPPSQYWDGDDGLFSSFALQIGTPPQFVRAIVSTAGWVTWGIGPDGCPSGYLADCANKRGFLYERNESLTWIPNSKFKLGFEENLDLDPPSWAGFDTVTLGFTGSGGPSIEHSTVYAVDSPELWLGGLGLNPIPANFTTMNDPQPSFMQQLINNNSIPSLSYGYTAGNAYRFNKVLGSLILGGYDANRFVSTNISFPLHDDVNRDLLATLNTITTDTGSNKSLLPGGEIPIFIDSTVTQLYLPSDACDAFEEAFGLTYNSTYNFYIITAAHREELLTQNANVTFNFGLSTSAGQTVDIVLPYRAFDLQLSYPNVPNTTYYFPLQRAVNDTQYTLGRTFLQEAYLITDYDRRNFTLAPCRWNEMQIQNSDIEAILRPGIGGGDSHAGLSGGAIAGIVVGVLVGIVIVAAFLWFFLRRKRSAHLRAAELEAREATGQPKLAADPSESRASLDTPSEPECNRVPMDELDSEGVHEMSVSGAAVPPTEMDGLRLANPLAHGYNEMEGTESYGVTKHYAYEMDGTPRAVHEMAGSDVQELPTPTQSQLDLKRG